MSNNEKLKVLMGIDCYFPSVDGVVQSMHNYLLELNKDNEGYSMAPKLRQKFDGDLPYKNFWCNSLYLPLHHECYPTPQQDKKFKAELEALDLSLIHIHSPFTICSYGVSLARKKGIPVVATFHTKFRDAIYAKTKSKLITNALCRKIGKNLNKTDEVYIANESMLKELRSYGYTGKVHMMPLGTEWEKSTKTPEAFNLVNETYKIGADEMVFLFVGRLETVKNIDFTIRALKQFKEAGHQFKFIIVGKGPELANLKKLIAECGLNNDVIFTGFIERSMLKAIYSRADVLLFPSDFDTFGLVKVEAAAFDTPTLTLENSCAGYGIIDNENGYLIKNDLNDYVEKLKFIIAHKSDISQVGKKAGETLYLNWHDATQCLIKRYRELLAEKSQGNKITSKSD